LHFLPSSRVWSSAYCSASNTKQPVAQCWLAISYVEERVGSDRMMVATTTAQILRFVYGRQHDTAPLKKSGLILPFYPGAYAAPNQKAPTWGLYDLFPRSEAFQCAEMERIGDADPGFALLLEIAFDRREDPRFSNTNPLIGSLRASPRIGGPLNRFCRAFSFRSGAGTGYQCNGESRYGQYFQLGLNEEHFQYA
jgi:hypothetical protein